MSRPPSVCSARMEGLDDPRPSYRQVADQLRAEIESGRLSAGDQLPTHKALAERHGVAVETVKRALNDLRAAGLISSRQGKGSYVRAQPATADRTVEPWALAEAVGHLQRELEAVKKRLAALESRTGDAPEEMSTQARSATSAAGYNVSELPGASR